MINSFRKGLAELPVELTGSFLGSSSPSLTFASDVDGFKFEFLMALWEKLEQSEEWGPKMREMRQLWSDIIFS
jgi:hypothetical protein